MGNKIIQQYRGTVNIQLVLKDKILDFKGYNEGLEALRLLFAKMLTRQKLTNEDVPILIDLRDSNNNTLLINKAKITDRLIDTTQQYNDNGLLYPVTFKSVITYSNLIYSISDRTGTYYLYLCSESKDLAKLSVSGELLSNIGPGVQAIIEWVLQLENA